jgi:hypothetical protein
VIIVADGVPVTDAVGEELRASGRPVRLIQSKAQSGPFASRRLGASLAVGQYLWFVDHDDLADQNFVTAALAAAQEMSAEIVECPILRVSEAGDQKMLKRFSSGETLQGKEILAAYLRGKSHHNLCNKLIERHIWNMALDSIGSVGDEMLTYAEDMLCTAFIYSHATSYCAIDGTFYVYNSRADSAMKTRDPDRVAQSIRSLAKVMSKLDPLLNRFAQPADITAFLDRELSWALNFLVSQLSGHLDPKLEAVVNSLRVKYLVADRSS